MSKAKGLNNLRQGLVSVLSHEDPIQNIVARSFKAWMCPKNAMENFSLLTDLYEFTMAQAYYRSRMFAPATFSLFIRDYPPNRGYFVSAGLADVLDYLERFRYPQEDLDYLGSTGLFSDEFLHYLSSLRFSGDVHALAEGRLFFKDEYKIADSINNGAEFDAFGVGTKMGTSADSPYTDMAYKLVEYDSRPVLKLSTGKKTLVARKQVFRLTAGDHFAKDLIALRDEKIDGEPLLTAVMKDGQRLHPTPSLDALHEGFQKDFKALRGRFKAIENPDSYPVEIAPGLEDLQRNVIHEVIEKELGES